MEVENEATVTLVSTVVLSVIVPVLSLRCLEAGVLVVVGIVAMSDIYIYIHDTISYLCSL